VKTPRTSTPSLKHITCASSKSDKTAVGKKIQTSDQNSTNLDPKSKPALDQQSKMISSKAVLLDQKKKKPVPDQKNKLVNDQQSKVIPDQRSKGALNCKSKENADQGITGQKKAKLTDQKIKMVNQNTKPLSDQSNKRPVDKSSNINHNFTKKGSGPMVVTASNIDSFIDQITVKPKLFIKKYSTRSTVKQSNSTKPAVPKNLPPKKLPAKTTAALQKSYKPVSPVVKLQQKRSREMSEAITKPNTDLSTFDFDDEDDVQLPIKKSRRMNNSVDSSCSSSVDVSTSKVKSFEMVPRKKGKKGNKKQQPVNRSVPTPHSTTRTEVSFHYVVM